MVKKRVTATKLRQELFSILDQIVENGVVVEIARKGHLVRLAVVERPTKISRLQKRKTMVGDPESFVHLDWSSEWNKG